MGLLNIFGDKGQKYVDSALQTLNIWLGTGSQTPTTTSGGTSGGSYPTRPAPQPEEKKSNAGTFIVIGASVLVVGGIIFYVVKKRGKR